jgi:hypothetical protein
MAPRFGKARNDLFSSFYDGIARARMALTQGLHRPAMRGGAGLHNRRCFL